MDGNGISLCLSLASLRCLASYAAVASPLPCHHLLYHSTFCHTLSTVYTKCRLNRTNESVTSTDLMNARRRLPSLFHLNVTTSPLPANTRNRREHVTAVSVNANARRIYDRRHKTASALLLSAFGTVPLAPQPCALLPPHYSSDNARTGRLPSGSLYAQWSHVGFLDAKLIYHRVAALREHSRYINNNGRLTAPTQRCSTARARLSRRTLSSLHTLSINTLLLLSSLSATRLFRAAAWASEQLSLLLIACAL